MRNSSRVILLIGFVFVLLLAPLGDAMAVGPCEQAYIRCLDSCDTYFGWHPILQVACYSGCSIGYNDCVG